MKKRFRTISMNQKIFFVTTFILLSSILVTGVYVQNHFRRLYSESMNQSVQLIMQKYSATIADYFYRTEVLGNMLEREIPTFFPGMEEDADVFQKYQDYLALKDTMNTSVEAVFGQETEYRCYLLLDEGLPMASMFRAPGSVFPYEDFWVGGMPFFILSDEKLKKEEWMQTAGMLGGATYWFSLDAHVDSIYSARNLNHTFMVNGKAVNYTLGTLVVSIDISGITQTFDSDIFGDNLGFLITDTDYRIVYGDAPASMNGEFGDLIEESQPLSNEAETEYLVPINEVPCRLMMQELPGNLLLMTYLPLRTLNVQVWENLQLIVMVFLVVLLAEVVLTAFLSRIITSPIRKLDRHIRENAIPTVIRHGYQANDEIGILYQTFNEMAEKNEALIQQIYDSNEQQKKLKYQMLQAQINPHFLYNTLDSVSCAALINGENELSDVLSYLARNLRYSIHEPDQLVTLKEELAMVGDYIAIQQFRCDNRIRFICETSQEVAAILVPKMILQPLLENGISYGRASADGYRYVSIEGSLVVSQGENSRKKKNEISIRVLNEYNPMEYTIEEETRRLNGYLEGTIQMKRSGSGLGVLNVQQRIQLAFGEAYGVRYEPAGHRMAAVITLPFFT